jgi:hypothetical protein
MVEVVITTISPQSDPLQQRSLPRTAVDSSHVLAICIATCEFCSTAMMYLVVLL